MEPEKLAFTKTEMMEAFVSGWALAKGKPLTLEEFNTKFEVWLSQNYDLTKKDM